MTFLRKIENGKTTISLEFFPPKTPEGWSKLYATLANTAGLQVDLASVTYGAGGTTRENTVDLVVSLQQNLAIPTMAHLTCVGHARSEIAAILDRLAHKGVPAIMALRGDPPKDATSFQAHPDGFAYASELIAFIRAGWPHFKIGCAAYPEGHPESQAQGHVGPLRDIAYLKEKQDQGADFAMTQLFFDNKVYYNFVELAQAQGVRLPLIPGIMPLSSVSQVERFVTLAGCTIPASLARAAAMPDVAEAGYQFALTQCRELLQHQAPGLHLYTLNQSTLSQRLIVALRAEGLL